MVDDLIYRIAQGDKQAMDSLYEETKVAVYGFALSVACNTQTAEYLMQETYIKVYSSAPAYIPNGNPMQWILTISHDLASMNHITSSEPDISPEDNNFQRALDRFVLNASLSILNDEERQIIMLRDVSGLEHREIAKILELPLPKVLILYQQALFKLKYHLKELI